MRADLNTIIATPLTVAPHGFRFGAYFRLLGCGLEIRTRYRKCLEEICDYYSAAVVGSLPRTPDVIVYCSWRRAGRYLFRSRPNAEDPLPGVWVQTVADRNPVEWLDRDPPIPPLTIAPFAGRFVGIHGAAVVLDGSSTLLIGSRGSGKTSSSLALARQLNASLLTDETICLHRRTQLVEAFPRPLGIQDESGRKQMVPAQRLCRVANDGQYRVTRMIFLNRVAHTFDKAVEMLSSADAMSRLVRHHVEVGSDPTEAIVTLFDLAMAVPASEFSWSTHEDLVSPTSEILSIVNAAEV